MCNLLIFRSNIELGDVTPHNLKQLRRLNQVVFPVIYNDKFYRDVLEAGELAKLGTKALTSDYSNLASSNLFNQLFVLFLQFTTMI